MRDSPNSRPFLRHESTNCIYLISSMDTEELCVYRPTTVRTAQYKEIIDQFPIGILIWQLENLDDDKSFICLSLNHASEA
jgi:hypothetical protein